MFCFFSTFLKAECNMHVILLMNSVYSIIKSSVFSIEKRTI